MNTSRNDRLHYLLRTLLSESPRYRDMPIPEALPERQRLLRALLNIRPPEPIAPEWIAAQDAELQAQRTDKGIVELADTEPVTLCSHLRLWQGDITRLRVDAIVNAANSALLGCFIPLHGCIDNAIHSAAGVQLRLVCDQLMRAQGHPEPTATAKITPGYNLPAAYVIHTVGPIIPDGIPTPEQEHRLADCYRACMRLASEQGLRSLAFCCISTGEFRFPNRLAATIAIRTVRETLPHTSLQTVLFNVFKDEDYRLYRELLC